MSEKMMQAEIEEAVSKFTPPSDVGGGFLSRNDFKTFAKKAITEGTLIGWIHAEKMTRDRMEKKISQLEYEVSCLKDRVKEVEIELITFAK